jgi:IclR family transcriptional regulator, mhp operon transcriptional activator
VPSYKPVTAALRVLETLAAVNRLDRPTSGDVARAVGISAATAVRMLETLEAAGFVRRDADGGTFTATGRTLDLSRGYDAHREVGALVRPVLADLQREVAWPSDLAIFDEDAMIVAETSRGTGRLFYDRKPGFRAPVFGTSLGIAYLSRATDADRERAVAAASRLPEPWNDLARDSQRLDAVLTTARERGYALMNDDYSRRSYGHAVWAFAVPLVENGRAIASLNLSLLRETIGEDEAVQRFLGPLTLAAHRMVKVLARG